MCFLDHSFGYNSFVFLVFRKTHASISRKKVVLSTDSQIQQLRLFLVEKSAFLRHRKLSGQVAMPL